MKLYISYGKYIEFNENNETIVMKNDEESIAFQETKEECTLKNAKAYDILDSSGVLENGKFAVLNNIPVTEEGRPMFEDRFQNRARMIEDEPGFAAIRVLRPLSDDTYVIMTLWESEDAFKAWQTSNAYNNAHKKRGTSEGIDQQKSIFARPSFVTTFALIEANTK